MKLKAAFSFIRAVPGRVLEGFSSPGLLDSLSLGVFPSKLSLTEYKWIEKGMV